jgi:hypothetical protein
MNARLALMMVPFLVGCGDPSPAPGEMISMMSPLEIASTGAPLKGFVQFRVAGPAVGGAADVSIPIESLKLRVAVDEERGVIERLELPLSDVDVPPSAMPPSGLPLRDLSLGMVPPVRAEIVSRTRDRVAVAAQVPLVLTWHMALPDGKLWRLGPAYTGIVTLSVETWRTEAGEIETAVSTRCPEECWSLPGIAEVRDLIVYAQSRAELTLR